MRRIDLNTKMKDWLSAPIPSVRTLNILRVSDEWSKTLRDFLKQEDIALFRYRNFGNEALRELSELLAYHGLGMGMTDEELAEYESEDARESVIVEDEPKYERKAKPDTVDWEQRRWELTKYLYELDYDTSFPATCIKKADKFIEEYKKSLNKEE